MAGDVKLIDIATFRELGFLQEANRLFFHPLGLALEVAVEDCEHCQGWGMDPCTSPPGATVCPACNGAKQVERLGGVWDYRTDPEGILYGADLIDAEKIKSVGAERKRHRQAREKLLGKGRTIQRFGDAA